MAKHAVPKASGPANPPPLPAARTSSAPSPTKRARPAAARTAKKTKALSTGLKYEGFRWGTPPPTRRQFGYAVSLGIVVRDGMTSRDMSDAIDDAIAADRPADADLLAEIREMNGRVSRRLTKAEAEKVIDFLTELRLACPFCRAEVGAGFEKCFDCGRSLKRWRIPIDVGPAGVTLGATVQ